MYDFCCVVIFDNRKVYGRIYDKTYPLYELVNSNNPLFRKDYYNKNVVLIIQVLNRYRFLNVKLILQRLKFDTNITIEEFINNELTDAIYYSYGYLGNYPRVEAPLVGFNLGDIADHVDFKFYDRYFNSTSILTTDVSDTIRDMYIRITGCSDHNRYLAICDGRLFFNYGSLESYILYNARTSMYDSNLNRPILENVQFLDLKGVTDVDSFTSLFTIADVTTTDDYIDINIENHIPSSFSCQGTIVAITGIMIPHEAVTYNVLTKTISLKRELIEQYFSPPISSIDSLFDSSDWIESENTFIIGFNKQLYLEELTGTINDIYGSLYYHEEGLIYPACYIAQDISNMKILPLLILPSMMVDEGGKYLFVNENYNTLLTNDGTGKVIPYSSYSKQMIKKLNAFGVSISTLRNIEESLPLPLYEYDLETEVKFSNELNHRDRIRIIRYLFG